MKAIITVLAILALAAPGEAWFRFRRTPTPCPTATVAPTATPVPTPCFQYVQPCPIIPGTTHLRMFVHVRFYEEDETTLIPGMSYTVESAQYEQGWEMLNWGVFTRVRENGVELERFDLIPGRDGYYGYQMYGDGPHAIAVRRIDYKRTFVEPYFPVLVP